MRDETDFLHLSFRTFLHPSSLILHPLMWYRRRDSNPQCLVPKTSASSRLGYAGGSKDEGGRMKDETEWCGSFVASSFIPHPSSFDMEEGTGVEPASDKRAVVFGTTALPVRLPFQKGISDGELRISDLLLALCRSRCWQGRSDLNRESRFWRPMVCRLAYIPEFRVWCMR